MSTAVRYGLSGVAVVAVTLLALWPFLDPAALRGLVTAAVIAVPVQVLAFWALVRARDQPNGFLAAWVAGMLGRMLVVSLVAFFVVRAEAEGAVPMLLGLAGFFFGLLLLEPLYFRASTSQTG